MPIVVEIVDEVLHELMALRSYFTRCFRVQAILQQQAQLQREVETLEEQWLGLQAELETLE